MSSAVTICNGALIKLGAARITNLNQNTVEAKLCRERYDENRKDLLRAHPWNFATVWVAPALVTPADEDAFKYAYVFQLPTDCLRMIETDCPTDQWRVEGDFITTDYADIRIRYTKDVEDVSVMDSNFCEVLSLKIAADICYSLVQSAALRESLRAEYRQVIREARSFNGQEGAPPRVYANSWLNSRRS